uniref:Uncharacterized protein n=1 Tax=Arcella intermedia TaxID=1963864 RepID=A0A6B2KY91_9EUKA
MEETTKENAQAANKFIQSLSRLKVQSVEASLMDTLYITAVNIDTKYANSLQSVRNVLSPLINIGEKRIPAVLKLESNVSDARKTYELSTEKARNTKRKKNTNKNKIDADLQKDKSYFDCLTELFVNEAKSVLSDSRKEVMNAIIGYCQSKADFAQETNKIFNELKTKVEKFKNIQDEEDVSPSQSKSTPKAQDKDMKAGYLYAKVKGKWKRRWVSVMNGSLYYYRNWKDPNPLASFDLMLCTIKPPTSIESEHHYFEIVSHNGSGVMFSASDNQELNYWVNVIKNAISDQLSVTNPSSPRGDEVYSLWKVPGNRYCADCNRPSPEWAVVNYGILICIDCSGIHRSLGSHISKVHSLKFDSWTPEVLFILGAIGNNNSNLILEANIPPHEKISSNAGTESRTAFITTKYVAKKFLPSIKLHPDLLFSNAGQDPQFSKTLVLELFKLLVGGLDVNYVNEKKESLLHLCVLYDSVGALQLLHLWGANLEIKDYAGRTPLALSAYVDNIECTRLLLTLNASLEDIRPEEYSEKRVYHLLQDGGSVASTVTTPRRNKVTEEVREIKELFEKLSTKPKKKPKKTPNKAPPRRPILYNSSAALFGEVSEEEKKKRFRNSGKGAASAVTLHPHRELMIPVITEKVKELNLSPRGIPLDEPITPRTSNRSNKRSISSGDKVSSHKTLSLRHYKSEKHMESPPIQHKNPPPPGPEGDGTDLPGTVVSSVDLSSASHNEMDTTKSLQTSSQGLRLRSRPLKSQPPSQIYLIIPQEDPASPTPLKLPPPNETPRDDTPFKIRDLKQEGESITERQT